MTKREPITVTLRLVATRPGCDIHLTVRDTLKRLLRTWGWRCVKVDWTGDEKNQYYELDDS